MSILEAPRVSALWLILGTKCNCNCTYCSEHSCVSKQQDFDINPRIYDFIRQAHPHVITFFGGEPLLYFSAIKEIMETLKDDDIREFKIITNGKALTSEMVEYINACKNLRVIISWDGVNSKTTRRYDVFADNKENVFKLNKFAMHSVITNYAYPLDIYNSWKKIYFEFKEKNGHFPHLQMMRPVQNCGASDHELFKVDCDRVRREIEQILQMDDDFARKHKRLIERNLISFYDDRRGVWTYESRRCATGIGTINMDLQGNVYSCHQSDNKIGDIDMPFIDYLQAIVNTDVPNEVLQKCKYCSICSLCTGHCKNIPPEAREEYCNLSKAFFEPFIDYFTKEGLLIPQTNNQNKSE